MLVFILITVFGTNLATNNVEQVHISLNNNPSQMVITWLTQKPLSNVIPFATYGTSPTKLTNTVKAKTEKWTDGGKKSTTRYTYRATLMNLQPGTRYYYTVGSAEASSRIFDFVQPDPSKPLRAAIYGDMSILNGYSIQPLINASLQGQLDIVFHIGDLAYDLDQKNGDVGDEFMNVIEPMTATVPFMVIPGNHEVSQDFLHFKSRFSMPDNGVYDNALFWSIDVGNTHFIGLNTEFYAQEMSKHAVAQYDWLKADLEKNTAKWTVVFMHRPMYCSNDSPKGCHNAEDIITRKGAPGFPGLEDLFNSAGVDLIYYAHKHTYERFWPMINGKPFISDDSSHINNSPAPVYTMTGSGGCHDHIYPNETIQQPFSIKQLGDYGYSILTVFDDTRVETNFIETGSGFNNPLDPFVLTKDKGYKPGQR